jgi:hypothetical protein
MAIHTNSQLCVASSHDQIIMVDALPDQHYASTAAQALIGGQLDLGMRGMPCM